jgi:hypothetical protein
MPANGGEVIVDVGTTAWMAVGQVLYVEMVGYFRVEARLSLTTVKLKALDAHHDAEPGEIIAAGRLVVAAGTPASAALDGIVHRVDVLESTPGGNRNYYTDTAPDYDSLTDGDIWYDTSDGYKQRRWDGSNWVDAQRVIGLEDFGTGLRPIITVTSLPASGQPGDYVHLTADGKLYRWAGGTWTRAVSTGDLVGQVDGSTFIVDGTLVASKFAAGSVTADAIGSNLVITSAANIGTAVVTNANIDTVAAGKITAGDLQAVNFGHSGRIFHTSFPARKFRTVEFGTSFEASHNYGSGSAWSFTHGTPMTAYCPGHASWEFNHVTTACPDADGNILVQVQGRLIQHYGSAVVYYQINEGPYIPIGARFSQDGTDAIIDVFRRIGGLTTSDAIKFYVAPADGNGNATPGVTCRFEIDVTIFNW